MIVMSSMSNNKDPLRDSNTRCTHTLGKESRISQSTDCSDQEQRFLQHFNLSPKPLDEAGQHHHTIPCTVHATRNNEISEYTGITRIVWESPDWYGIILAYQEKEIAHDRNGRITNDRRCSPHPADIRVHCQRTMQTRRDQIDKSWQELESQAGRFKGLHKPENRQKIKPARCWQRTNKTLVAFRSLLMAWTPERNDPRQRIPSFIIHDLANIRKVLCSNGYAEEKVYP
jgi:hypothetical protein